MYPPPRRFSLLIPSRRRWRRDPLALPHRPKPCPPRRAACLSCGAPSILSRIDRVMRCSHSPSAGALPGGGPIPPQP